MNDREAPAMTLHTAYNASEVDNRFWVSGGSAKSSIYLSGPPDGDAPLGRLDTGKPLRSIRNAHALAAARLGVHPDRIGVADYLTRHIR